MSEAHDDPATPPKPREGRRGRATRPRHPDRPCLNCGDPTPGEYCPSCGQRKVDVRVSVRMLAMEVLEDQFILDKRLPRTLHALLLRPGHLTVEYVNGRMVRYIHPFRLYLVSSLIFFVLLSFFSLQFVRGALDDENAFLVTAERTTETTDLDAALAEVREELADTTLTDSRLARLRRDEAALLEQRRQVRLDSVSTSIAAHESALMAVDSVTADSTIPAPVRRAVESNRPVIARQLEVARARRDTVVADSPRAGTGAASPGMSEEDRILRERFGWDDDPPTVQTGLAAADSAVAGQIRRLGGMTAREAGETLLGTFFSYVPTVMFILLPVFAVVLKLLYIRRRRFYAEHFVFLLHVHSLVFILATVMLLLRNVLPGWLEGLLWLWVLVYIYLAMMRVYGQGWLKTFVKYWTLGWMYFWILVVSAPLAMLATLLLF